MSSPQLSSAARIQELNALYDAAGCSAAALLCDRHDPHRVAYRVVDRYLKGRDVTYLELRTESERFAAVLASQGVRDGDRVATLMDKGREYLTVLMGIWRLGAVHVPLFTAFAPPAIAFRLIASGAKLVVCDQVQRDKLRPGQDIPKNAAWRVITTGRGDEGAIEFQALMAAAKPGIQAAVLGGDAPLILIYTSGTTGTPKGVLVPIRALASFQAYGEFGLDLRHDDVYWCGADPGWAYGLYFGILASFTTGVRSVLLEGGFRPEAAWAVLSQEGVTNFAAAPTVFRAMRASGIAPNNTKLRCASSAGEPLTPDVNEWAMTALGVVVHDHYGQTETGMLINNHHHPAVRRRVKVGSMGHAMPGWSAAVLRQYSEEIAAPLEVGRLAMDLLLSPLAWFKGYFNDPAKSVEKFTANGRWYLTGDTVYVDEEGHFHFSARDDDVIIMAGYRIGPFEVESAIATHPAVAEAAIIAVSEEIRGEVIEAYVVLREPDQASPGLAADLQQWVKARYAAHAHPRVIHFVNCLPKTPSGKTQRFVLRQQRRAELDTARGPTAV